jgi:hypothetical protein
MRKLIQKVQGGIMRHLLGRQARALPTGENRLTPLHEFTVTEVVTTFALCRQHGQYQIVVNPELEVGYFRHAKGLYEGRFWLAGRTFLAAEHLLPRDVQTCLMGLGYEVA